MTHSRMPHQLNWHTFVAVAVVTGSISSLVAVPSAWASPASAEHVAAQEKDSGSQQRVKRDLAFSTNVAFYNIGSNSPYEYMAFVNQVRDAVSESIPRGTVAESSGIRQTRADRSPITVRLGVGENVTDGAAIDLLIHPDSLYVVGWGNQLHRYWLQDDALPRPAGFVGPGFGGSYIDLASAAGQGRADIPLGQPAMDEAVRTLARDGASRTERARAMTVLIQMVSEAARFNGVAQAISGVATAERPSRGGDRDQRWYNGERPSAAVLDMENSWGSLSRALAELGNGRPMANPVRIGRGQVTDLNQLRHLLSVANRNDVANARPALVPHQPDVHTPDGPGPYGTHYTHDEP
ncbi:ribosome-inactivating family protein [Streptomyces goshikiensis]|uniref:ribosome-inactivating family protein n=1 Tax=Streptomyces goshikiensis TaxID=1942 RepID=UPI0036AF1FA4